jgi:CDP-glucose 4,6-dehydratase
MHYLITGHTGFKGSWLALMLEMQGHTVSGISLNPPTKSLFNQANLAPIFKYDFRQDIRDRNAIKQAIKEIDPEVIIHLAAQPLVRESYRIPIETFEINVLGTLNVLEATKELKNLKATLIITTDKVYKNHNHLRGYVETDELGGEDPYSASKAAADLAAQSWIKNFATIPMAIARAGNVIGGGDWAQDRIIPDLVNAYSAGNLPTLRYPNAIRPWQHVLDCLNGYLTLIDKQITTGTTGEWNFSPDLDEKNNVGQLVTSFTNYWGITGPKWIIEPSVQPQEASYLLLNSGKAQYNLGWKNKLSFLETVRWTYDWYKADFKLNAFEITKNQIQKFLELTQENEVSV